MQTLLKTYVVVGGVAAAGFYIYQTKFSTPTITTKAYYMQSVEILKGYKPAMQVLGVPVDVEYVEKDNFNQVDDKEAKIKLLVTGKKKAAELFVYASRDKTDTSWQIDQLDIRYKGSANRYKFFENPNKPIQAEN